jgi:hypothetical protein
VGVLSFPGSVQCSGANQGRSRPERLGSYVGRGRTKDTLVCLNTADSSVFRDTRDTSHVEFQPRPQRDRKARKHLGSVEFCHAFAAGLRHRKRGKLVTRVGACGRAPFQRSYQRQVGPASLNIIG